MAQFQDKQNANSGIKINQIIKFGVCVNNNDPQRAGRIRAVMTKGEGLVSTKIEDPIKAIKGFDIKARESGTYKPWGKNDPYTFAPFLPLQLNVIPIKGEAVKIIGFGGIPLPEGKGCFPNPEDIAIVGRENCDIVLGMREKSIIDGTEDKVMDWYPQILIRSGKLIKNNKYSSRPSFNPKQTFIQLNTFPTTLTNKKVEYDKTTKEDAPLATLIQWNLDNSGPAFNLENGILSGYVSILKVPFNVSNSSEIYMAGDFNKETLTPPTPLEACRVTFSNAPSIDEIANLITNYISAYG